MGRRRMHIGYWSESQKVGHHWEDQDLGGWAILKLIFEIEWNGMDWIDVTQDGDQWRALVSTVMILRVP
jgi:hypothetical protein